MTVDPTTSEPESNPDASEDPHTETPGNDDPSGTPTDNPSGSTSTPAANEQQGDDVPSDGS